MVESNNGTRGEVGGETLGGGAEKIKEEVRKAGTDGDQYVS